MVMSCACRRHMEGATTTAHPYPVLVLVTERPHCQYGSVIFVKASSVIKDSSISEDDSIEVLSFELSSIVVTSVYKPPAIDFKFP